MQAERLGYENRDTIREIVRTEERKYRKTLERGSRKVESLADEYAGTDEPIPTEVLLELYDSHGIQPDMVADIAAERGATVDVPDDFYALVADRHEEADGDEAAAERDDRFDDLPRRRSCSTTTKDAPSSRRSSSTCLSSRRDTTWS